MIPIKQIEANSKNCFYCKIKIENVKDYYCLVKKCVVKKQGNVISFDVYRYDGYKALSIMFCEKCWQEMAGSEYELEHTDNVNTI